MKARLFLITIALFASVALYGQTSENVVTGLLLATYSERE